MGSLAALRINIYLSLAWYRKLSGLYLIPIGLITWFIIYISWEGEWDHHGEYNKMMFFAGLVVDWVLIVIAIYYYRVIQTL